ncbi:aldehyde dehydrogenase [Halorubrum sp. BOL3-1]|uniref:aldehyde dehydrogenase family protein n=1 Tax=Halorubrum sp. BOL3-1 TaxID=2497325 RepID=UPI00100508E1|nr:aldehyde dehydrogenase family protein [Halorubrum sp. BOL3-1]QAU11908.1 aldehyde dehydrogenase [Halorubrum sp. BOL3-1]
MTNPDSLRSERLYVDGQWREGADSITVRDLADGGEFARVAAADSEQAEDALAAAADAQSALRETTPVERARWLESIADELESRADEFTDSIVREAGKPVSSARGAPTNAARRFRLAAGEARDLARTYGEYREGATPGHEDWTAIVRPEPIGTVLCVAPYNYPLQTTVLQVAPALAAGNAVVVKPSSKTPATAALLTDVVVSAADLPDGAFNFVPGRSREIGDTLAGDDRVDTIAMTGSSGAGKHVASESGITNLVMELGGNAPALVFPDADLSDAAGACATGSFKLSGQRCSAVSRVIAHESVHDDLVEQLAATMGSWVAGDLFDESTNFGPLIDESHAEEVAGLVDAAVEDGADLVVGGERDGAFHEPTLLANVPQDAEIIHREQFGPVAAVTTFETEAEAIELANDDELALDASVFTTDHDRAMRVAERVDAGSVRLNGAPSHGLGDVPFGGNDASGINREGIHAAIEQMIRKKSIVL